MATVVGLNAKRVYNKWTEWRSKAAAADIQKLIDAGQVNDAFKLAGEAYRKYPNSPAVLRLAAQMLSETSRDYPTAAALIKRVLASGKGTLEDQVLLAEMQAKSGDLVSAKTTLSLLPDQLQNTRQALEARSMLAGLAGDKEAEDDLLRRALQADPDNRDCQLKLAIMDEMRSFETGPRGAIVERIWKIARGDDEAALKAIVHLAGSTSTTATQITTLLDLVTAHPAATDKERYIVLQAHHRLRPLDTERLITSEMNRQRGKSAQDMSDFFRWLVGIGQHAKIRELLPLDVAMRDTKSMLIYIDALSAGGEWGQLVDLMQKPKLPITTSTRNLVLGQSYGYLDNRNPRAASQFLREAITGAGPTDREILLRASTAAEALGLTSLAREACQKLLTSRPDGRTPILEKILELSQRERDTQAMLDTLKELIQVRPGYQAYVDQLNYIRLITGTEMELAASAVEKTDPLTAVTTQGLPPAFLSAVAARQFGKEQEWKNAAQSIKSPERLGPGMRAVLAGYYSQIGDRQSALRLGETLVGNSLNGQSFGDKRSLLLDEELKLLESGMR